MTIEDKRYPEAHAPTEPEWNSIEEERDYWKKLAQGYAAKINMLRVVLNSTYDLEQREDGNWYSVLQGEGENDGTD